MRFLFFLLFAAATMSSATPSSDDEAIRSVIQRYVDVRNHFDEGALRELFTPDADQLVSSGEWRRGLENLVQGAAASSKKENGQSSVVVEHVRLLGPDVALVDGRYETSAVGASSPRKMWSTFVLLRLDGRWRIAAIRNMLPTTPVR
jgi:uncharacterized protein (TIGR02246 family)